MSNALCTAHENGTMCDLPEGHSGWHSRSPLYDEHPVLRWPDHMSEQERKCDQCGDPMRGEIPVQCHWCSNYVHESCLGMKYDDVCKGCQDD